jgi:hypothetical protein
MEYAGIFMDSRGICIGNSMKRVVISENARIHADEVISAESNVDVPLPYVRVKACTDPRSWRRQDSLAVVGGHGQD